MSSNCPSSGAVDPTLVIETKKLEAGKRLFRFHGISHPADSFNTNVGKRIEIPEEGARFNPFPGAPLKNIGTPYAASTLQAAALESVFHDVDHVPSPRFPKMKLTDWRYSHVEVQRDLGIFELTNRYLLFATTLRERAKRLADRGRTYPYTTIGVSQHKNMGTLPL